MKCHRWLAVAILTIALVAMTPAAGFAATRHLTPRHAKQYRRAYRAVVHKFGKRAPGRNIVRDGLAHRPVTDTDVVRSLAVLHRMMTPAHFSSSTPQLVGIGPTHGSYSSTASRVCGGVTPYPGGGDCWAIPYYIVLCESHGQNVPNSKGSGANGYYQLMNGGTGSRSEQDQAAAALWNGGAGASNWKCA